LSKSITQLASRIELWPVDRLQPYAKNARTHSDEQVAQIAASMREFGFTNPILVDSADGIIAGHGRLQAARTIGLEQVPVIVLDHLTDAQRRAYILADNKLALNAGWDDAMLAEELRRLDGEGFNVALTGFSDEELEGLLVEPEEASSALTDPDEVPEIQPDTVTKLGDVWLLGKHRVMCGSSTNLDNVDHLLLGKKAHMVFTDPPYLMNFTGAINHEGKKSSSGAKHAAIANDNLSEEEGQQFLRDVATAIKMYCDGAWYVCFYRLGIDWVMNAMTDVGLKWRNLIIWKKNNLNLSNSDYKSIYEPIIYGWSSDYEPVLYGWNHKHEFHGSKGATDIVEIVVPSIWEIEKTKKNDLHPTMKPVALCEAAILNSSKTGQTVLDLFGGSGSTLIAAERNQRVARLMELEPKYVDVIVRRWQEFTGKAATLESDGRTFADVESGIAKAA
jgi:DNA modification methylase